jgi:hypothetical protein
MHYISPLIGVLIIILTSIVVSVAGTGVKNMIADVEQSKVAMNVGPGNSRMENIGGGQVLPIDNVHATNSHATPKNQKEILDTWEVRKKSERELTKDPQGKVVLGERNGIIHGDYQITTRGLDGSIVAGTGIMKDGEVISASKYRISTDKSISGGEHKKGKTDYTEALKKDEIVKKSAYAVSIPKVGRINKANAWAGTQLVSSQERVEDERARRFDEMNQAIKSKLF